MTYISQKLIKPRKPHPCRVCGTEISISEQCISYTGVDDVIYTIYFHFECWDFTRDWDESDWETYSPGFIGRKRIQSLLAAANEKLRMRMERNKKILAMHSERKHG